ncbi:MAG: patatin-like phospholipase family protein [Roseomonas sp.]|nr:patatin-like phospholipase family protein [Roseomonas sp.]MCA3326221.1 patatin-like phospholipase family protein [Roseomonas sp.]MCA3330326.1 patatin-like phospholipase family protein [Roseomonas sp.]MCA3335223.1 patatin-like phospholipase family protein [Roseomonas sp.]MCA3348444.1 patatin-like phospholipase family protein [Roseomonas sp.]
MIGVWASRAAMALMLCALLAGCASVRRLPSPPSEQLTSIDVLGVRDSRFWADGDPAPIVAYYENVLRRRIAALPPGRGGRMPPGHFLALSGGADNGAFGAGVLNGWTETGQRPAFDMVTGVSAGALIAPFAFLGPAFDDRLRALFTEIAPNDVVQLGRVAFSLLFREAIADTAPLARLIDRHADEAMLRAIAAEHERGRLLLIGTVNLDVGRPVVWNIGAIAASGHPDALTLIRRILLASSSIPGAFPPVLIDVEVGGRRFQEMHVDGGAAMQVFLYPPRLRPGPLLSRAGVQREITAWVIRNGRVDVAISEPPGGLFSITRRSALTLLHFSSINDLDRIYLTTYRDRIGFRLQSIGQEFDTPRPGPFDNGFMRALFAHGEARGRDLSSWRTTPPPVGLVSPPPPGP